MKSGKLFNTSSDTQVLCFLHVYLLSLISFPFVSPVCSVETFQCDRQRDTSDLSTRCTPLCLSIHLWLQFILILYIPVRQLVNTCAAAGSVLNTKLPLWRIMHRPYSLSKVTMTFNV